MIRSNLLLPVGYASLMLIGFVLLVLPWSQTRNLHPLDVLFVSVSAVSTTGLSALDVGKDFNFFGQLVLLLLIQVGGIGYMSIASFVTLGGRRRLSSLQETLVRDDFGLPAHEKPVEFVKTVVVFSLIVEALGAIALMAMFYYKGVEQWFWSGLFHSVSAFCTAGFSIFSDGLARFADSEAIVGVISLLSLAGAIGFIVFLDLYRVARGSSESVCQTTRIILFFTFGAIGLGTAVFFTSEPSFQSYAPHERLLHSFFQCTTALTTVGFNTVDIGAIAKPGTFLLLLMMVVGASPSGTGGGLKSTTVSALWAVMASTFSRRAQIVFRGKAIPADRVRVAVASSVFYGLTLATFCFLLTLTESGAKLEDIVFEAFSALGTVGISRGLTGDLSVLGTWLVIGLMYLGRVGPLSFGLALFGRTQEINDDQTPAEDIVL